MHACAHIKQSWAHVLDGRDAEVIEAPDVDAEAEVPVVVLDLEQGPPGIDAGHVGEAVDPAQGLDGLPEEIMRGRLAADVAHDRDGPAAAPAQVVGHAARPGAVGVDDRHGRPGPHQPLGERLPEPVCTPGHDDAPALHPDRPSACGATSAAVKVTPVPSV